MGLRETTLTHLYGVPATILGVVGTWALVAPGSPWQQYALVASGWVASLIYATMLVRSHAMARKDGEDIGTLRERVAGLERTLADRVAGLEQTLAQRSATLDYIAGVRGAQRATPRATSIEGGRDNA
jgi:hypothetical protein